MLLRAPVYKAFAVAHKRQHTARFYGMIENSNISCFPRLLTFLHALFVTILLSLQDLGAAERAREAEEKAKADEEARIKAEEEALEKLVVKEEPTPARPYASATAAETEREIRSGVLRRTRPPFSVRVQRRRYTFGAKVAFNDRESDALGAYRIDIHPRFISSPSTTFTHRLFCLLACVLACVLLQLLISVRARSRFMTQSYERWTWPRKWAPPPSVARWTPARRPTGTSR